MLTNCLAECAHLTITVSQIERDIGRKSSFFHTPLHSTPPLGGSRRNSATPFGTEKLVWLGYPMVKKFRRYLYSFWRNSRTWWTHRRTDGHRVTEIAALCIASHGKNCAIGPRYVKADYRQIRSIARPLCDSWASCFQLQSCSDTTKTTSKPICESQQNSQKAIIHVLDIRINSLIESDEIAAVLDTGPR